jgi:hypothetical protein
MKSPVSFWDNDITPSFITSLSVDFAIQFNSDTLRHTKSVSLVHLLVVTNTCLILLTNGTSSGKFELLKDNYELYYLTPIHPRKTKLIFNIH